MASGAALTHPIQVSRRVPHIPNVVPILPGVRQGVSSGLLPHLHAVSRSQRVRQTRFSLFHKDRELVIIRRSSLHSDTNRLSPS